VIFSSFNDLMAGKRGTSRSNLRGLTRRTFGVSYMPDYSIGLDLGGTISARRHRRRARFSTKSQAQPTSRKGRSRPVGYRGAIQKLRVRHAQRFGRHRRGLPGFIRIRKASSPARIICRTSRTPGARRDRRRLGTPVTLENDANARPGREVDGAGREVDDLVLLTLGTGIGGASSPADECCRIRGNGGELVT